MNHAAASQEIAKLIRIVRLARHVGNVKQADGKWIDLMTPQTLQILLEVSMHPGITMKQLVTASGVAQSSVSRNLMVLGKWHRSHEAGLDLVETIDDPREWRRKAAFLTVKGRKFMSDVLSIQTGERATLEAPTPKDFVFHG